MTWTEGRLTGPRRPDAPWGSCPLARLAGAALTALVLMVALVRPVGAQAADEPAPGSRAAAAVDDATGAVLYARNADTPLPPASLTKMVTALVAVERASLDRPVRVTHPFDVVPVVIGLEPGDVLPLEEVLYGLLLNSGNDAALAIAETVGDGSVDRFVGWMNELVGRLGLTHSRFRNPHGLDQDGHVASAYDLAIIGRALLRQPVLARIVAQGRHEFAGPPRWVFRTTNPLLGVYVGVDGIKTGYDDLAGRCLVATAERDGRRAITVVLNSPAYAADAASLLDYAFSKPAWGSRSEAPPAHPARERPAMLRADLDAAGPGAPRTLDRAAALAASAVRGPSERSRS